MTYKSSYSFLLLVFLSFFFFTCTEENDKEPDCLPAFNSDVLMFRVIDKNTGEDLFFGEEPYYSVDDLHVLRQNFSDPSRLDTVSKSQKEGHFHVVMAMGLETMYLSIADTPLDTLIYTVKPANMRGCPTVILDGLVFNHSQVEENIHGRGVTLRK